MKLDYIHTGHVFDKLKLIPDNSCRCCVTSPPYWGLRDYGTAIWVGGDPKCTHSRSTDLKKDLSGCKPGQEVGYAAKRVEKHKCKKCGAVRIDSQLGMEKTPEEYIANMVKVFREVKRILTDDGTLWLNIGDSYFGGKGQSGDARGDKQKQRKENNESMSHVHQSIGEKGVVNPLQGKHPVIKPKDLVGIPWMLAFALRADGWFLRSDIIWHKPNPMPESVVDRPTKSHEYIFLLTKSKTYYYDLEAIKTIAINPEDDRRRIAQQHANNKSNPTDLVNGLRPRKSGNLERKDRPGAPEDTGKHQMGSVPYEGVTANKRTVWSVAIKPFKEAHYAVFPEALIVDCIKAGSSEGGKCMECGSPFLRLVKKEYKKHENWFGDKQNVRNSRGKAGSSYNEIVSVKTEGWKPSCNCSTAHKPDVVLDPFMGAGTTALVAKKLGRQFIGVELNPENVKLSVNRLKKELGTMFYHPQEV